MNIWLINHYAVPPRYYPLARQTCFAKYLQRMGHRVTLISASSVHNSKERLNLITDGSRWREEVVDGVDHVYIRCCDYEGNGWRRIYNMCEFAWKLPGVCKKLPRPDAIVATSMPPMSCAMGIRIARAYGVPGIAEIADLWPESIVAYGIAGPRNPAVLSLRRLEKWIYTRADAIVFTMEGAYDYILEQGWERDVPRGKVFFINNGVDLESFAHDRASYRLRDADLDNPKLIKVVYTGSIRRVNHLGLLLDAAGRVRNPAVRFLIWGDGDEREALERRAAEERIGNVVFKGKVDKKYIPYIVSKADINLLHGGSESNGLLRFGISPNKLFDYFAAGRPLISDSPAKYNPMETYSAGLCLASAEELPEAIERIASMSGAERERMCGNVRAAAQAYNFEALTRKLLEVIEAARSGKHPN